MNQNIMAIMKKIIATSKKNKDINPALKYALVDGDRIVAIDTKRMFIATVGEQGEKRLMDIDNPYLLLSLDSNNYPKYERLIPSRYADGLKMENSDINYVLADIYKTGILIEYKNIEMLLSGKAVYTNLEFFHDKENLNNPVMIKGQMDGYNFIFVLMPLTQR